MLIELQIRRPGGSKATVHGVAYHFRPRVPDGPHVEEVEDPAHAAHFLGISKFRAVAEPPKQAAQIERVAVKRPRVAKDT